PRNAALNDCGRRRPDVAARSSGPRLSGTNMGEVLMWKLPYSWLRRETAGAVRQGLSFDYLMSESHIDLQYGDDRDVIGPAQAVLLCMNTVLALQDSAHGLASASIVPRHSELSLRIALGSATLEASINS